MSRIPKNNRIVAAIVGALWLVSAGAALAQVNRVDINTSVSAAGTRVLINHTQSVDYAVQESDGRLEVIYTTPVRVSPRKQRFEGGLLKRYEQLDDRTLLLVTRAEFTSYESFDLRNPFRLVIDLRGRGSSDVPNLPPSPTYDAGTIVVLDPGHGGAENGAVGPTGLREKDVTLDLARRLKTELQQDANINVVLTRDEDRALGLDERTAIANHNRADLFVSIHLNASRRSRAKGAETYFLSRSASDDAARTLAAMENRNFTGGGTEANGETLDLVLWDLAQNQYLAESSALAEEMQRQLNQLTGTRNRGVRQAPFRVLMGATMPAILVEVGFISNADEELQFKGLGYRSRVVEAMANAIRQYVRQLEESSSFSRSR